ncbi:MAG TPA: M20/M25/M40 family metallo-hydrolase [Candidatus Acidoferrum sp.]|nr:M20/M25/M40 family metallo-hydrolase [Candidatus Acidoferrum sp.]
MNRRLSVFFLPVLLLLIAQVAAPQVTSAGSLEGDLGKLVSTPAVSGYEGQLGQEIRAELGNLHPTVDNIGDVIVTLGSGSPHRLIVTPIDEPGFVVSGITDDGYLRVQRLPQNGLPPIFNELYSAQPVKVETAGGKWIDGVVAGLSVHLQPGRMNPPRLTDLENIYVDIGATSAAEVRKAGIDNLSPVVINRRLFALGYGKMAGASIGDRFGAAALLNLLREVDPSKIKGTLTVAFVVQQRTGARGLERILTTNQFDEMIYVGRLLPGGPIPGAEGMHRAPRREPGSGVLVGLTQTDGQLEGFAADLKQLADANKIPLATDYSSGIVPPSYLAAPSFPAKWTHIGIATAWPDTPAELIDWKDQSHLMNLLDLYLKGPRAGSAGGGSFGSVLGPAPDSANRQLPTTVVLQRLVESYGVSNHEGPVRDEVKKLLPPWAKPETDDAGDLVLRIGTAPAGAKTPSILVVAHMDEIGYEVKSISNDGRLEVTSQGGGEPSFFLGHPALVHTTTGDHDAIMELPNGWDDPKFEWPRGRGGAAIRVDVGAHTPDEVEKLGIKVGDTVTIPKAYRPLLGTRANGRSFDDRVGCTALISAAWALGGPLKDRNVTFVFSTAEELGLNGAAATAKRLGVENHPDYVFAVDTFVSSDSPIESKRFADAPIGKGFVIRAVDNSNIVRPDLVERVIKLARANQIPVQYGVTGGGNDGSTFLRYGSVDIALGWPLRYSHSPAEVIDTRDVDALAHIITAISKSW